MLAEERTIADELERKPGGVFADTTPAAIADNVKALARMHDKGCITTKNFLSVVKDLVGSV